jgi:hypothetical protein
MSAVAESPVFAWYGECAEECPLEHLHLDLEGKLSKVCVDNPAFSVWEGRVIRIIGWNDGSQITASPLCPRYFDLQLIKNRCVAFQAICMAVDSEDRTQAISIIYSIDDDVPLIEAIKAMIASRADSITDAVRERFDELMNYKFPEVEEQFARLR